MKRWACLKVSNFDTRVVPSIQNIKRAKIVGLSVPTLARCPCDVPWEGGWNMLSALSNSFSS